MKSSVVLGSLLLHLAVWLGCHIGSAEAGAQARGECIPTSSDHSSFQCYDMVSDVGDDDEEGAGGGCNDSEADCQGWAEQGECARNPNYMLLHCPRSCETCVSGHAGVVQVAPLDGGGGGDRHVRAVAARLVETQAYLRHKVQLSARFLQTCRNHDALCTHWATLGECERNPSTMRQTCPAACRKC